MFAAIYARKSTEQLGVADDQKSVARQVAHARDYARSKGWVVSDDHVFIDDGISGAEFANRPGLLRLMNALKPRPPFQALIMSEESRLGREAIETAYALKQLVTVGVRVFFYLENRERTLDSPTDKIMLSLTAYADELEREKARQRTYDAMLRKARAGHATGGRTFGYDNEIVLGPTGERAFVVQRVNPAEAAVVRHMFELAAAGEGIKAITKQLNAEGVASPRAQRGRPQAWAPSSVRAVLHREVYRGRRIWNKTRKRDAWGRKHQHDRPPGEWLTVEAEALRIVPESVWTAAHERMAGRRAVYVGFKNGTRPDCRDGRGVRKHYFLAGFGRCAACGGSMQVVSRASSAGRIYRYACATHWNRGASVCANGRMADMVTTDDAVRGFLATEVLRPRIVERALDRAVAMIQQRPDGPTPHEQLVRRLATVEAELANLSETAARGGAVPAILQALSRRDEERRQLTAELATIGTGSIVRLEKPAALRARVRGFLDDWASLLNANVAQARTVLEGALRDRIGFTAIGERRYRLMLPIAFDRVVMLAVPELQTLVRRPSLQDMVTSPTGFDPILRCDYVLEIAAA